MLTLEKPDLDDTSQLAATTIEALNELLAASAPPAPTPVAVEAPQAVAEWVELATYPQMLKAAKAWCQPTPSWDDLMAASMAPVRFTGLAFDPTLPPTNGNVATLLEAAAEGIKRNGWVQRRLVDGARTCLVGGILARLHYTEDGRRTQRGNQQELYNRARCAMTRHLGMEPESWNDTPGRTPAEVVSALRECARQLRQNA